jgi:hypothetical protein
MDIRALSNSYRFSRLTFYLFISLIGKKFSLMQMVRIVMIVYLADNSLINVTSIRKFLNQSYKASISHYTRSLGSI